MDVVILDNVVSNIKISNSHKKGIEKLFEMNYLVIFIEKWEDTKKYDENNFIIDDISSILDISKIKNKFYLIKENNNYLKDISNIFKENNIGALQIYKDDVIFGFPYTKFKAIKRILKEDYSNL